MLSVLVCFLQWTCLNLHDVFSLNCIADVESVSVLSSFMNDLCSFLSLTLMSLLEDL